MENSRLQVMVAESLHKTANEIFERYLKAFNNEVQGVCPIIADEIIKAIGGRPVAGYLTWYGGSCRRSHWWCELDGETFDPMGDWVLKSEVAPGRIIVHKNKKIFKAILPKFEHYRI